MSKKKKKKKELKKIRKELRCIKIPLPTLETCPNCGERFQYYTTKKGKQKGIQVKEVIQDKFIFGYYGTEYTCYTCSHTWFKRIR